MRERGEKARAFTYPNILQHYKDVAEQARQQFASFQAAQALQKVQRQTGLAASQAALAAAELRDNELKGDLEKLTVRAPADGVVSYGQIVQGNWQGADPRLLRVGERATAQSVLMTVFTPGKLRLVMDLAESKYFALKSGQKASISPVAYPELKYEGLCEPDQHIAGTSGSFALHIATGEIDSRLLPGMKATVHMEVPLVDNALLAPTSAVSNSTVWVNTSNGEEARQVLTGRSDGKQVEILSGLKDGEQVLTTAKP
jgi:multidrug efflux pump subunit AcrA (membrane-fusion protein)